MGHLAAAVPMSGAQCYSRLENHWFCTSFLHDYRSELTHATTQHLWITLVSVALGLVVGIVPFGEHPSDFLGAALWQESSIDVQ